MFGRNTFWAPLAALFNYPIYVTNKYIDNEIKLMMCGHRLSGCGRETLLICPNPVRTNKRQNATLRIPIQSEIYTMPMNGRTESQSVFIKICFVCDEIITVINWINKVASINSIAFAFVFGFRLYLLISTAFVDMKWFNISSGLQFTWKCCPELLRIKRMENDTGLLSIPVLRPELDEIQKWQMCQLEAVSARHFSGLRNVVTMGISAVKSALSTPVSFMSERKNTTKTILT